MQFLWEPAVTVRRASVTDDPLHSCAELAKLEKGAAVYLLGFLDEKWAYIESGNVRGFVLWADIRLGGN